MPSVKTKSSNDQIYQVNKYGGEYLHTSAPHFMKGLGSFGNYDSQLDSEFNRIILEQEKIEKEIDKNFSSFYEGGLSSFIKDFYNLQLLVEDSFNRGEVLEAGKGLSYKESLISLEDLKKKPLLLQRYLENMENLYETLNVSGINKEDLAGIKGRLSRFSSQYEQAVSGYGSTDEKGQRKIIRQLRSFLRLFRGVGQEIVTAAIASDLFQSIEKNMKVEVSLPGTIVVKGKTVKVDTKTKIEDCNFELGISVKATGFDYAYKSPGVSLHSTAIQPLINLLSWIRLEENILQELKYFLINVSRNKAAEMKGATISSSLKQYGSVYDFFIRVLEVYAATYFIGKGIPGFHGDSQEEKKLFDVDVLVLRDVLFLKSTLLKEIRDHQARLDLKMKGKASGSETQWEEFDKKKAIRMKETKGNYGKVKNEAFLREAINRTLNTSLQISMKLLRDK